MKRKLLLSAFLAAATWSLSSLASADWDTGPCPGGGTAPCIETEVSGTSYHFNGAGDRAGEWHGLPTTGEDFEFSGPMRWNCGGFQLNCTLAWKGNIKKCHDNSGDWRIGLKVTSTASSGSFACDVIVYGGFPWYATDPALANHCPFEDTCDSFVPYDPTTSSMAFRVGSIEMAVLGTPRFQDAHIHGVTFIPGTGAILNISSEYYDCEDEEIGCSIEAELPVINATSLDIK